MRDFCYRRPRTLDEALRILAENPTGCKALAGGTDLLVRLKDGQLHPDTVIDLTGLDELREIREEDGRITIGGLVRHNEIAGDARIRAHAPLLAEACSTVGGPQIRNMGTIAGNIVNASPAAETVPSLVALDAEVLLESRRGSRWVPIGDFATGPSQTCLAPDELLTRISFEQPSAAGEFHSFYLRVGPRRAVSIAKLSMAFLGWYNPARDGFRAVRIALGAVAPTVIRAHRAERFLEGKILAKAVLEEAAGLIRLETRPITDVRSTMDYRRQVAGSLLIKGLQAHIKEE